MKGIKSVYTEHKAIIIALAAIVLAALFLNILTVPTSDDLGYSISNGLIDILHRECADVRRFDHADQSACLARLPPDSAAWSDGERGACLFVRAGFRTDRFMGNRQL